MQTAPSKVCVLGRGGAGKTALALRLAGCAPDDAAGRPPVWRLLHMQVEAADGSPRIVRLFDGPGRQLLDSLSQPLLMRAMVWLLVADGSEPASLDVLPLLYAAACTAVQPRPTLVLLNKADLGVRITATQREALARLGPVHEVSARTGQGIDGVRAELARLV